MPEGQGKPVSPELLAKIMDPQDLKKRREQVGLTAGKLAQASGVPLSVIFEHREWPYTASARDCRVAPCRHRPRRGVGTENVQPFG